MQERFDAVIVAGYDRHKLDPLTEQSGEPHKVLIKIAGKPMIWYVVNALVQSQAIDRIVIVGLGPEDGVEFGRPVHYLPDQGSMFDNVIYGFNWLAQSQAQERYALLLTGDIPLLTSVMVDQFVVTCQPLTQDVYWGIVEKRVMEATFPLSQRSYLRLMEGQFCNGNLFLGKIAAPLKRQQLVKQMLDQRKSVVRQLRLLGFGVIIKFLFHRLRLRDLLGIVQRALDLSGAPVILPFAEAAMDVDKPHQLAQVVAYLEQHSPAIDQQNV
ncbi:MAG: NTP transferase domain-containing protein [Chloroflexi bacterium]|nr:NTP transferase domain-containing protein [Chloroflexota bacterium]